jgi:hypothetical protein
VFLTTNVNNLEPEMRNNVIKDLMANLINEIQPGLAEKVLADIIVSTDVLDDSIKEQMMKNMLEALDELPQELKSMP